MNTAQTANLEWLRSLQVVKSHGSYHAPRGRRTIEMLNHTSMVDMRYPVVTVAQRKMGMKFLFAEAYWILSGDNRLETILPYAKDIAKFSDDTYRFQGAYGPKVTEQLRYVCETIAGDVDTRQAIISIWRENPRQSKDIPCTISLQFLVRDGRINTIANMRSSDLWLGWVYDVFNFSMITSWVALRLKELTGNAPELGTLYLNAGSQHIYDENWPSIVEVLQGPKAWSYNPLDILEFNGPIDLMKHLMTLRDKDWGSKIHNFMGELEKPVEIQDV